MMIFKMNKITSIIRFVLIIIILITWAIISLVIVKVDS